MAWLVLCVLLGAALAQPLWRPPDTRNRQFECSGDTQPACCSACVCVAEGWTCDKLSCSPDCNDVTFLKTNTLGGAGSGRCEVGSSWSTGRCGEICVCQSQGVTHCALAPCLVMERGPDGEVEVNEEGNYGPPRTVWSSNAVKAPDHVELPPEPASPTPDLLDDMYE